MLRPILKVSSGACAILMLVAVAAWACTGHASVGTNPGKGAAGTVQVVSGSGFGDGTAVEVRWDSTSGPLLGTAVADPALKFETTVELPRDAAVGVHTIVAFGRTSGTSGEAASGVATQAAAPFTITGPYQGSGPTGPGDGGTPDGSLGSPDAAGTAEPTGSAELPDIRQGHSTDATPVNEAVSAVEPAPARSRVPARPGAVAPSGAFAPSARAEEAAGAPALAAPVAAATSEEEEAPQPVASAAAFPASDEAANAYRVGGRAPSLLDNSTGVARHGSLALVGVGLLAVGSLALFAGFAILQLQRRKALGDLPPEG